MTVEEISTHYKRDDINNELKNYLNTWDELLHAKTDTQRKKALVKSIINRGCMLYVFKQYDSGSYGVNTFAMEYRIIKSFSSDATKYIKANILEATYHIGHVNYSINNYIYEKIDININSNNDNNQKNICQYNKNTETIFQELLSDSDFKEMYNNLKLTQHP